MADAPGPATLGSDAPVGVAAAAAVAAAADHERILEKLT